MGFCPRAIITRFIVAVSSVPKARRNTMPATMIEVREGMKNRDLKKLLPLTRPECRMLAIKSGKIVSTIRSQKA